MSKTSSLVYTVSNKETTVRQQHKFSVVSNRASRLIQEERSACTTELPVTENQLLLSLPEVEVKKLLPALSRVCFAQGTILHESGHKITEAYFPVSGVVSLGAVMSGNLCPGVGLTGREGIIGAHIILRAPKSLRRVIAQTPVSAFRISGSDFQKTFETLPVFRTQVLRYVRGQVAIASQIAACNGLHRVEQRLSMWLLMSQDRWRGPLPFTQEFLAEILGLRRTTVTEAARALYKAHLIEYSRGHITVLDRGKLQSRSCECYRVIRRQSICE
jgi:CRP-like cAMP-binding protein